VTITRTAIGASSPDLPLMGHLVAVEVVILFEVARVTADCLVPHSDVAGREEMPGVLGNHVAQLAPRLDE
jgi:hypothetical protein